MSKNIINYFIPAAFQIIPLMVINYEIMNYVHTSTLAYDTEKVIPISVQCPIKNTK